MFATKDGSFTEADFNFSEEATAAARFFAKSPKSTVVDTRKDELLRLAGFLMKVDGPWLKNDLIAVATTCAEAYLDIRNQRVSAEFEALRPVEFLKTIETTVASAERHIEEFTKELKKGPFRAMEWADKHFTWAARHHLCSIALDIVRRNEEAEEPKDARELVQAIVNRWAREMMNGIDSGRSTSSAANVCQRELVSQAKKLLSDAQWQAGVSPDFTGSII